MTEGCVLACVDVHHTTRYAYRQAVQLGPHRLMLRPRESRDLRLLSSEVEVSNGARIWWSQDVAGNAIATATFEQPTDQLVIHSRARVEIRADAYPVFDIAASALSYPFRYPDDEWADLAGFTAQQGGEPPRAWAQAFVAWPSTDTLSLLKDINTGTCNAVRYETRDDEGTQSPEQTLASGRGSCRDIATLFVAAVRSLGFGARAVSGYLHDPERVLTGSAGGGSTHAWAEVYVPGAGWIAFDPTNRTMGGAHLIPVAVARDIRLAVPVSGSFAGPSEAFESLSVEVNVQAV